MKKIKRRYIKTYKRKDGKIIKGHYQTMKIKLIENVFFWIVFSVAIFYAGFIMGIIYQQVLFTAEISKIFNYANIDVNFNETKFMEEFNKTVLPTLQENLNKSLSQSPK